jgi:anti-sigma B factor antagonist
MSDKAAGKGLHFHIVHNGNVPEVKCSGRLVAGYTDRFYSEIKKLTPEHKRIVVDFAEVARMDSSGLGSLARLYVHAKSVGCVIDLVNVGKSVRSLLGITHMMSVFQMVGENNIRMG